MLGKTDEDLWKCVDLPFFEISGCLFTSFDQLPFKGILSLYDGLNNLNLGFKAFANPIAVDHRVAVILTNNGACYIM